MNEIYGGPFRSYYNFQDPTTTPGSTLNNGSTIQGQTSILPTGKPSTSTPESRTGLNVSTNSTIPSTTPSPKSNQTSHPNAYLLPKWDSCGVPTGKTFKTDPSLIGSRTKRIFSGRTAGRASFLWVVEVFGVSSFIVPDITPFQFVTAGVGAIINNRYVVTSASAIRSLKVGYTPEAVYLGGTLAQNHDITKYIDIEEIIVHENYASNNYNQNIALLRLGQAVNATPICLPGIHHFFPEHEWETAKLTVAGFGSVTRAPLVPRTYPEFLQYATVQVQNKSDCERVYSRDIGKLGDDLICASDRGVSPPCFADDGAPLMACNTAGIPNSCQNFVQVGINSNRISWTTCGNQGFPGVYTKLDKYIPWILDNIRP